MDQPVGYWQLIKTNANFRNLWFGQIVSLLGDWFNLIASATLIASLSESGSAVASLFVVRMLAPFLVSAFAGVVADRYNKKLVLIITDLARAATLLCFLFIRDAGDIWLLYLLTGVQFAISGFFTPIRTAILPELVSERELGAANTLGSATWSVMLSLGAAIGGLVSGLWGIYPAFVIDAFTFLLSAFFIMQIRLDRSKESVLSKSVNAFFKQYLEGLQFLLKHRNILITAFHKSMLALLAGSTFEIVLVNIAEDVFHIGQGGGISLGLMFMMTGLGSGLGPIVARRFTADRKLALSIAISVGYLMIAVGYLIVSPLGSFAMTLLGIALRGLGGGVVWTFSTQLLLLQLPRHISGRVFASEFAFFTFTGALGAVIVGRALDVYSIPWIIVTMATLVLVPAMLWTFWIYRQRHIARKA